MTQAFYSAAEKATRSVAGAHHKMSVCMHVLGVARTDVRVMREASALAQAGLSVSIVDFEKDHTRPRKEDVDGIHIKHSRVPLGWFTPARFKPWFLVKLLQAFVFGAVEVLRTPADVYHAHDDKALPACYLAARLRRKPLIFDAHELPLVEPSVVRWRRLCVLSKQVLRSMISGCTGVITVSPPIRGELQRIYGGPKAAVVRNMLHYQPPQVSNWLRQHLGLSPDTRIALYQGNVQTGRGLELLIRAARFMDDNIVIVMMGRDITRSDLEKLIAQERVADRVKILPPVPYAELLTWTASADIGLIVYSPDHSLNVQMCLPNKLFEYLMAGLPVLASSLDAVVDVIRSYDVGDVVSSLEPAVIGHAISTMLSDSNALTRMRSNALVAARQDLCWEEERQNLTALYEQVLHICEM